MHKRRFSAARERDDIPAREGLPHSFETIKRLALAGTGEMCARHKGRKSSIPRDSASEKHEVLTLGVGASRARGARSGGMSRCGVYKIPRERSHEPRGKRELRAVNGRKGDFGRRLHEANRPIKPIVIDEGQTAKPKPSRFLNHVLGTRSSVEKTEV